MKQKKLEIPPIELVSVRQRIIDQVSMMYSNVQKKNADLLIKEAKKIEDYILGKK